jgi:cyclic lactone autoinducer peptide
MSMSFAIQFLSILAQFTETVAAAGAGIISSWGWHQPKVPECLTK